MHEQDVFLHLFRFFISLNMLWWFFILQGLGPLHLSDELMGIELFMVFLYYLLNVYRLGSDLPPLFFFILIILILVL